ncbi:hypothetical protein C8F04DRAFT_1067049 [Mycena alexandri]|uniref:Uncharacterized protein n=1 Tax=Mycena alexandri TaxID=1745969 RepID=A0AAD6XE34_9AGAR|nr:hypothetical protein C8F04DRAFT_1067049 [Mycena alexandri]
MPFLPPELEREIVETAVRTNHKDAVVKLNLSLVAHHFHFWVDQVFYESVTIHGGNADKFLTLVDLKPAGFFATVVKVLSVRNVNDSQTVRVLAACPGIQVLVLWLFASSRLPLSALDLFPLRRLATLLEFIANILTTTIQPNWVSTLTHLDLHYRPTIDASLNLTGILRQFPRLSNFALLFFWAEVSVLAAICADFPGLRVFVITTPRAKFGEYSFLDPRIVLVEYTSMEGGKRWEVAPLGLPDIWTHAESVVDERLARLGAAVESS